jgi:N-acetylglucosaminyldiphosphoundecaprenol N-acetyl-beta-D-mannosaminyltransferase
MKIKNLVFKIDNLKLEEALEYLIKASIKRGKKTFVVTINAEIIMLARNDKKYEKILNSADLILNDSIGVTWARKMFGRDSNGRVHGVDLVEKLSELASSQPIEVGFLGGCENVALDTSRCLRKKYPGLKVAFAQAEWPDLEGAEVNHKSSIINHKISVDILFVAFGSPKQEKWIYKNLPQIDTKVAVGVGGAFDFISGKVRRAPVWVRRLGLEWLFRLIIQPWRIKRQIELPKFVFLVLMERIGLR